MSNSADLEDGGMMIEEEEAQILSAPRAICLDKPMPLMELNDKKNYQTNDLTISWSPFQTDLDILYVGGWCMPPDGHEFWLPRLSTSKTS